MSIDKENDKSELTMVEAQELWNKYYPDCAKHIKRGDGTAEMVIWIDMYDAHSYGKHSHYISTDAESDGVNIWVTKREYFPREFKIEQSEIK